MAQVFTNHFQKDSVLIVYELVSAIRYHYNLNWKHSGLSTFPFGQWVFGMGVGLGSVFLAIMGLGLLCFMTKNNGDRMNDNQLRLTFIHLFLIILFFQ